MNDVFDNVFSDNASKNNNIYHFNNFINQTYYINLKSRPDRKIHIEKQLSKLKIQAERYEAIQGKPGYEARMGCRNSHFNIIQKSLQKKINKICILEDDCIFDTNFHNIVQECFMSLPEDWDFLFLGHCYTRPNPQNKIHNYLYKAYSVYCTHAYCLNIKTYGFLLNTLKRTREPIDHVYNRLSANKQINTYICYPAIVNQVPNKSDIGEGPNNNTNLIDADKL